MRVDLVPNCRDIAAPSGCYPRSGSFARELSQPSADHGKLLGDTVHGTYDESRQVFADLEKLGIGYDDVVQVLEDEGVTKFEASWTQLLETISAKMGLG